MLGMAPSAGFAKYQRTKPHLNVGTIGKFSLLFEINQRDSIESFRNTTTLCSGYD